MVGYSQEVPTSDTLMYPVSNKMTLIYYHFIHLLSRINKRATEVALV